MTHPFVRRPVSGFSLIELMVSMAIALVLTIVIARVMIDSDASKRTSTALNDANQNGAIAAYELDRLLRSSGSGFMQSWNASNGNALGCLVRARLNNAIVLPRPTAFPAPFAATPQNVRLVPFVIMRAAGATAADSDVLRVMGGNSGFAEVGRRIYGTTPNAATAAVPTAESIRLINILGWKQDDLVLLTGAANGCTLQQVGTVPTGNTGQILTLGGPYAQAGSNATVPLYDYAGGNTFAIHLGNISSEATRNNPPDFRMYGVDTATASLVTYDMLQQTGNALPIPIADSVVGMKAAYGIDANLDGVIDGDNSWVAPTGNYAGTEAALLSGSAAAQQLLRTIVAVRVALVVRSPLAEKNDVNPVSSLTLFAGSPAAITRTLTADEKKFRHRVVEITVPIRNMQFL